MYYCRFSSDDYQCDVHVFADADGRYRTHVAGQRVVLTDPLPPPVPFDMDHIHEWMKRDRVVMKMIAAKERETILLPQADGRFTDDTPAECLRRLKGLRELGYRVPQHVIDTIAEEAHGRAAA